MSPQDAAVFGMMFMGIMLVAVVLILRGPVGRALSRRIDGTAGQAEGISPAEAEELRHRIADMEQQQTRLQELEERLDFAERLLAQSREPVKLPGPGSER